MGADLGQLRTLLAEHRQDHLLAHWDSLTQPEQARFQEELAAIDLDEIAQLFRSEAAETDWLEVANKARGPKAVRLADAAGSKASETANSSGLAALAAGEVAVLIVAGGQGTRLGFDHPKGMFPIASESGRTLFQIHIEKLLAQVKDHNTSIPLYLMTSPATHHETVEFLEHNQRFGLPKKDLEIFCQGTMPAVDATSGKLLLADKGHLALGPDGHGGVVEALQTNGLLADMQRRGIRHLFYMQVDNPLVSVADPEFIGHHLEHRSQMSTQVVRKEDALEKVGNVVSVGDRLTIIEYSDLPDEVAHRKDDAGDLMFWAGNIAVHAIDVDFLSRMAESQTSLPWHIAHKKVPHLDASGTLIEPSQPNALKFERFIFDLLPEAAEAIVVEVPRSSAFAPVKSAEDVEMVRRQLREHEPQWL